ncbi:MAG TPA: MASE1 domain-containing protein, partial [Myxococcales bacterium]|nr:MASE1 domain-containing protein [Myxococcales bacterium]
MRRRDGFRLAVVFAAYVVTARAGLAMDAVSGFATLVWAPSGISLVAIVAWGFGMWPAIALGATAANVWAGAPVPVALAIAAGNTGEAVAGAWLLRAAGFDARLQRLVDGLRLVLLAGIASTVISAAVGVLALGLGGITPARLAVRTWRAWWVGDLMGDLLVAPLLFLVWSRPRIRRRPRLAAEVGLAIVAIAGTVVLVFLNRRQIAELHAPAYLLFPVLVAVTVRFAQYGAVAGNFFAAAAALSFTALGYGPFVRSAGLAESLLQLQVFIGVLATTTLVLGAVVAERDRAVEAREDFLSVASHELRTPLTSLSLQVQLLARASASEERLVPERLRETATAAVRQARKLGRLVDQLLDVSRIDAGRLRLEREHFDLGDLAREIVAGYDGSEVAMTVEYDGECKGFWDRMRIGQVVDNLLSNAVRYGEGKPVEIQLRGTPGGVVLSVRDHGIGIASSDRERIFER